MIHGSISGISKGPLVVFEKEWGKIDSKVYCQWVLPSIHHFVRYMDGTTGFMKAILMEDGASQHTSKFTKGWHAYYGMNKMVWPAQSPDLNPIENVWRLLKYRVGKRFPTTDPQVRQYIEEEWTKMKLEDFVKYIREMHKRYVAVINAEGGTTKW